MGRGVHVKTQWFAPGCRLAGVASFVALLFAWPASSSAIDIFETIRKAAPKEVNDLLNGNKRPAKAGPDEPQGVTAATGVMGLVGLGVCAKAASGKGREVRGMCALGAAVGVEMT